MKKRDDSTSRSTSWHIDTNAGPIVYFKGTEQACRAHVEQRIPLLRKRGYTCTWTTSEEWRVINVHNTKGRIVHSAAFRPHDEHRFGVLHDEPDAETQATIDAWVEHAMARAPKRAPKGALAKSGAIYAKAIRRSEVERAQERKQWDRGES